MNFVETNLAHTIGRDVELYENVVDAADAQGLAGDDECSVILFISRTGSRLWGVIAGLDSAGIHCKAKDLAAVESWFEDGWAYTNNLDLFESSAT